MSTENEEDGKYKFLSYNSTTASSVENYGTDLQHFASESVSKNPLIGSKSISVRATCSLQVAHRRHTG